MPFHSTRRAIALALACTLLAAGAAGARPLPHYPVAEPTVTAPALDLRNPDNRAVEAARAQERYYSSYAPEADQPAQDLRSPDTRDAAAGRGTFNAPEVMVLSLPQPAAPSADGGIDWGDAGIGAASLLVVVAFGLAGTAAVVRRRTATAP